MDTFNLGIIFWILFIHWILDFWCQTSWQAENKSHNPVALLRHTVTYSALWFFPAMLLIPAANCLSFVFITFGFHTITDFWTSKLNAWLWKKKEIHWFFVRVGFDQLLHYVQLFLTFHLLST